MDIRVGQTRGSRMGCWLGIGIILIASGGCRKAPTEDTGACTRPTDVVLTEQQVDVATAQIGKASVGGLKVVNNSELVQLLSSSDRSALIVNFMICEAQQRGELDPKDQARVDYVTRMLNFLYVAKPGADAFDRWLKDNPAPTAPSAKLDTPDFDSEGEKLRLAVNGAIPLQSFRLMNTGRQPLVVWVAEYPRQHILFAPHPGPYHLEPGATEELTLALLCCSLPPAPLSMHIRSDVPTDAEVEVVIADAAQVAKTFSELTRTFAEQLNEREGALGPDAPERELDPAARLAALAQDTVRSEFTTIDARLAWGMGGSILESLNWPDAAVVAYRKGREASISKDDSFDIPLSRALYYAGLPANTRRGEVSYVELAGHAQVGLSQELTHLASLDLASTNPLASSEPALAQATIAILSEQPRFQRFALGLQGDLYLAQDNPEAAIEQFDQCFEVTGAPSCGLRRVEAGVMAQDYVATSMGLEALRERAPDQASRIWASAAMNELESIHPRMASPE